MGTILLIDDNPLRAGMRTSILESIDGMSPEVVRVQDAAEALCIIEDPRLSSSLSVVVCVHFGAATSSISGPELVGEIRERLPLIPIVVLGAGETSEAAYSGIPGVLLSQTKSPQELRSLVARAISQPVIHAPEFKRSEMISTECRYA